MKGKKQVESSNSFFILKYLASVAAFAVSVAAVAIALTYHNATPAASTVLSAKAALGSSLVVGAAISIAACALLLAGVIGFVVWGCRKGYAPSFGYTSRFGFAGSSASADAKASEKRLGSDAHQRNYAAIPQVTS